MLDVNIIQPDGISKLADKMNQFGMQYGKVKNNIFILLVIVVLTVALTKIENASKI